MKTDNYKQLIRDAKDYYISHAPELSNIKGKEGVFDLGWCPELHEEINLWTYWQGRGQDKANIMIVGQDFGNYEQSPNHAVYKRLLSSNISENKEISQEYIDLVRGSNSPTDKGLISFTEECLGKNYSAGIPANKNLFFTNLCLGYRSSETISGGDMSSYLKHDSIFLKRLIEIKRPELVICLGADTFLSAIIGLTDDKEEDYKGYISQINSDFWSLLDSGDNAISLDTGNHSFKIFGVSHTGSNGRINRKRLSKVYKDTAKTSIELMHMDWINIRKYIKEDYMR